jgi:hypothetical protein
MTFGFLMTFDSRRRRLVNSCGAHLALAWFMALRSLDMFGRRGAFGALRSFGTRRSFGMFDALCALDTRRWRFLTRA